MDIEDKPSHPEQGSEGSESIHSNSTSEVPVEREVEKEIEGAGASYHEPVGEPLNKKESVNNVSAIPNGGLKAWLQVLGSFFLFFNTWGIINTYGVLQTFYQTDLLQSSTPSAISWVGSIQSFLLMLVGTLTGPIYDAGYFRHLLITGTFFVVLGTMMLSLCHNYWQVLLAQAFCVGIGCGCLFVPSVAILSTYFTTRIAFAVGLAASGSSLGGVIYPIMFHKLQPQVGFGWAIRIWGFVILAGLLVPILVMKMRVYPSTTRPMLDLPAFKHLPYSTFILGCFLGFMGLYAPFFYVQLYDEARHITDPNLVFYLLAFLNAASIFGRIIPNFIADYIGPFNMIVPCALATGILTLTLVSIRTTPSLIVFLVFYGFFSGTFVSLPPSIIISLSPNRGLIGTHMGMAFALVAVGLLVGTPIAGAILKSQGFTAVWIFGGVLTVVGSGVMWIARVLKVGPSLLVKA